MNGDLVTEQEVTAAMTERARQLGWVVVEWDWRDSNDGVSEYRLWLQPLGEEAS